jgi:hypothetical protein
MDPIQSQNRGWVVDVSGEEIARLQSRLSLSGSISEGWEDIRDTAAYILGQCPNPVEHAGRATGLALGKIQSGKTLSYTALIALAVDNGYRITVVLAGTKNPLLKQNYNRLCSDLEAPSLASMPRITPFENPVSVQDDEVIESVLQARGHILIVVLKHRKHIEDVRTILARSELNHYPTLIIDDEGDEASLNTQFRTSRRSATYNSILNLRDALQIHAYIAYTATPQAPLLISGIDALSPDFGVLIQPGQGYCGGSIFFGPDQSRYIREIPADEASRSPTEGIPFGLRRAIATFLVGGAIRHLRTPSDWHHSMLINNSRLRVDHARLQNSVKTLVNSWKDTLALSDSDPALTDLMVTFRAAYDDLCLTVQTPPIWDDVKRQLRSEIILLEVWMVNSLPLGRDPIGTPFRLTNNILIGGNMLGRGVTIPGLAVTYITRRAQNETNADTMEQRARWFGYKQPYLDICRIFLTGQLTGDYTELLQHEDDFWDSLSRNQRQGLSIREWPRMLRLDSGLDLQPTRQNVANYKQFRGQGWETQRTIILDPQISGRNIQTARDFFERHGGQIRAYANTEHKIIQDCPTDLVISELLGSLQTSGTNWDNSYQIEYLTRLLLAGRLPTIDVLLMSKGDARVRSLAKDASGNDIANEIDNPIQGPTEGRRPGERDYYPGDQHLHNGRPQLQVHCVNPRGTSLLATILALYIPQDDRYTVPFVVRVD